MGAIVVALVGGNRNTGGLRGSGEVTLRGGGSAQDTLEEDMGLLGAAAIQVGVVHCGLRVPYGLK